MSKDTGGPAFPVLPQFDERRGEYTNYGSDGISMRDYFAAAALQGWLASFGDEHDHPTAVSFGAENQAQMAYALADAMLKERAK